MVERLVTRFRVLLGGRGEDTPAVDGLAEEMGGVPGPDPEWDELVAWARESEDEVEWTALIAQAKQAIPSSRPGPAPHPALPPLPLADSIASLSARLERLAAQVPDARRRAR